MKCSSVLGSSSNADRAAQQRVVGSPAALLVLLGLFLAIGSVANAKVFYTQEEALKLAFPDADRIEKETHILSVAESGRIEKLARSSIGSRLITIYTGWKDGLPIGYAHIDVHTVRTQPEGFMVVLDANGGVRSLRVLAFYEPLDYLPAERWYGQFYGKTLAQKLRVDRDIHGVVGATLSARAAADGVRRALAYYDVLIRGEG